MPAYTRTSSQTCNWALGCGNITRNPSGACYLHNGRIPPKSDGEAGRSAGSGGYDASGDGPPISAAAREILEDASEIYTSGCSGQFGDTLHAWDNIDSRHRFAADRMKEAMAGFGEWNGMRPNKTMPLGDGLILKRGADAKVWDNETVRQVFLQDAVNFYDNPEAVIDAGMHNFRTKGRFSASSLRAVDIEPGDVGIFEEFDEPRSYLVSNPERRDPWTDAEADRHHAEAQRAIPADGEIVVDLGAAHHYVSTLRRWRDDLADRIVEHRGGRTGELLARGPTGHSEQIARLETMTGTWNIDHDKVTAALMDRHKAVDNTPENRAAAAADVLSVTPNGAYKVGWAKQRGLLPDSKPGTYRILPVADG